jgi:small subunit ribosomal protein S2
MKKLPAALFVIDAKKEEIAIKEAKRLNIPVVAVIDTNSDPDIIDYPIPGNDDALRSISLLISLITESIIEGCARYQKIAKEQAEELAREEAKAAAGGEISSALAEEEIEVIAPKQVTKKLKTNEDATPRHRKKVVKTE